MAVTEKTYRRAELASLAGLLLQAAGAGTMLLLSLASDATSVMAESLHWFGGLVIWILLLLVFHQKRLEALEQLELDELRRQREGMGQSALFEVEAEDLLVAGRRLRAIVKYVLPITTVILALYHVLTGAGLFSWLLTDKKYGLGVEEYPPINNAHITMVLLAGAAFAAFVLSRMVMGLAKERSCRMLRAGGNYLTGNCFASIAVVLALGLADFGFRLPELILARIIPILMVLLGVEMILNLVLEMYRPRVAGSEPRPAIESRLLGLISEPGDVARSIAEAMNYQFGFEISKTWFYQLLQKALGPLVLFQLASLLALSILVIVEPGEKAVIERFGQFRGKDFGAGLHLKLPWPLERVQIVPGGIHEIVLGAHTEDGHFHDNEDVVMWTHEHAEHGEEYDILVPPPSYARYRPVAATQPAAGPGAEQQGGSVSVHLLRIVAVLRYQVADPVQYLYNYSDPKAVLLASMQEAFLRFAASRDSDQFMLAERRKINEDLLSELRQRIARMDPPVGVELVDASLVGVHPPPDVAESYEQVGGAQLQYQQAVRWARGVANQWLAGVAGSVWRAQELAKAINTLPPDVAVGAAKDVDPRDEVARGHLADLMAGVGGTVAQTVDAAEAERTQIENGMLARVIDYRSQLRAYQLTPRLYMAQQYLNTLAEVLPNIRKYVIASPTQGKPFIVNFEMKDQAGLFELGGPPGR
jgi:regulator of protease activity HflC (stomatin/prohibitin superfamily)